MELADFFAQHPSMAVAFSGGVDSSYLLVAAQDAGYRVTGYFMKTPFQPRFELEDAQRLAEEFGVKLKILHDEVLEDPHIRENGPRRCYYCKKRIMAAIVQAARMDGYRVVVDGTNASDDVSDRPGMEALVELQVLSPLRAYGLTKERVRELSRERGIFTWDKPSYACLATRIPTGVPIQGPVLERVEGAEEALKQLGFSDFRVRVMADMARLQLPLAQWGRLVEDPAAVRGAVAPFFSSIVLDLLPREVSE